MNSREIWETALDRWSDMESCGYKRLFVAVLAENISYDSWLNKDNYKYFEKGAYADGGVIDRYSRILNVDMKRLREAIYRTMESDQMEYQL